MKIKKLRTVTLAITSKLVLSTTFTTPSWDRIAFKLRVRTPGSRREHLHLHHGQAILQCRHLPLQLREVESSCKCPRHPRPRSPRVRHQYFGIVLPCAIECPWQPRFMRVSVVTGIYIFTVADEQLGDVGPSPSSVCCPNASLFSNLSPCAVTHGQ